MIFVVDTHSLAWFLEGNPKLSSKAKKVLSNPVNSLIIPSIVLAEIKYLYEKKRIKLPFNEVRKKVNDDERCEIYPLDETVLDYLPENLDIHDGIICATTLTLQDTLGEEARRVTKDKEIISLGLVKTTW